ncbi:MAG: ABC transporter permease [Bryobacteraceae bacterium]|nr:ABC transporter permease [Bryobacteraceae bacterium]
MFHGLQYTLDPAGRTIQTSFQVSDVSQCELLGYQIFDPITGTFILEGEWHRVTRGDENRVQIALPPERGSYRVFLSLLDKDRGWLYSLGKPFLLFEVMVEGGRATLLEARETTMRALGWRSFGRAVGKTFVLPFRTLLDNRSLIRSMVRRDIMARYRGSFGDVLWTVLNPLLLTATYFFVFGIVLQSRFGADNSRTGFVLYLLAGLLPWLAFSEAVGRSPYVMLEHRNFIRKLVFPVEILPASQTFAALVSECFALGIFLIALLAVRGSLPATALWLPVVVIPQVLFTLGTAWLLSSLGVFLRDLGQIMGFLLTLWFFLTPICYPESAIPAEAIGVLASNPIFMLVRCYRSIFLENAAPPFEVIWKLWLIAAIVFLLGHACFYKLRSSFADVI